MGTFIESWTVLGILVPLLIAIGVGVMSMSPPEYLIAKVSFTVAAFVLAGRLGWWMMYEMSHPFYLRLAISFLMVGLIGSLWAISLGWVAQRQASSFQQHLGQRNQLYREVMQLVDDAYNTAGQRGNLVEIVSKLQNAGIALDPYIKDKEDRLEINKKIAEIIGFCIEMAKDASPRSEPLSLSRAEKYAELKYGLRDLMKTKLFPSN